jgi:hypothetical protein
MLALAENYRAFKDRPWNVWEAYKHLDRRYPDSLFILTIRDPESWWRSVNQWVTTTKPEIKSVYAAHLRVVFWNKYEVIEAYHAHNEAIQEYFQGTGRLLVLNLEHGNSWQALCSFLGTEVPSEPFPKANSQSYKTSADSSRKNHQRSCPHCGADYIGEDSESDDLASRRVNHVGNPGIPSLSFQNISKGVSRANIGRDSLAVVSCFFNPTKSEYRVANVRRFQENMTRARVPFLIVELAFNDQPFCLSGENVLHLRSESILWHKERLLNIAIQKMLDSGYLGVAWLDCDVSFEDDDWPRRIAETLCNYKLCQVFSEVSISDGESRPRLSNISSVRYLGYRKEFLEQEPLFGGRVPAGHCGYGWAARAEVLRRVLLYDRAVVGGGDRLILGASYYQEPFLDEVESMVKYGKRCTTCGWQWESPAYTKHFLDWAAKWQSEVEGSVGYALLKIEDSYHGPLKYRFCIRRRRIITRNGFDPVLDVAEDANGVLTWASDKPQLHDDIMMYFNSRRENT